MEIALLPQAHVEYVIEGTLPAASPDEAIRAVHAWNDRKRVMFRPDHIRVAWDRLHALGWLPAAAQNPR